MRPSGRPGLRLCAPRVFESHGSARRFGKMQHPGLALSVATCRTTGGARRLVVPQKRRKAIGVDGAAIQLACQPSRSSLQAETARIGCWTPCAPPGQKQRGALRRAQRRNRHHHCEWPGWENVGSRLPSRGGRRLPASPAMKWPCPTLRKAGRGAATPSAGIQSHAFGLYGQRSARRRVKCRSATASSRSSHSGSPAMAAGAAVGSPTARRNSATLAV